MRMVQRNEYVRKGVISNNHTYLIQYTLDNYDVRNITIDKVIVTLEYLLKNV